MLRYKADRRTLAYMAFTTALFGVQWYLGEVNLILYPIAMFMAVAVAVIAHNHNHLPIWRNSRLNAITDYWITLFYGFPAFAWIPTHNANHHMYNNREGDYTITYRATEENHLLSLLSYPSISGFFQQRAIAQYLRELWRNDRAKFFHCIAQYVILGAFIAVALLIDWRKAIYFVIIPQQFALFVILIFNYVQHVHADEMSELDHSRNFVGFLNTLLFNNGYHTVHHERAGLHWSLTPEAHAKIADRIDPALNERSFWWYIFRVYFLAPLAPRFKTVSKRLARMEQERLGSMRTYDAAA
jgi:fatty acid desaturase